MHEESRAQATKRVTCQAAAWLWHRRSCRILAEEVGVGVSGGLTVASAGMWRADLVGGRVKDKALTTYLVEVKGTYADLAREKIAESAGAMFSRARSKWYRPDWAQRHELWVACGDLRTGLVAVVDVPEHWGVIVFAAATDTGPKVLRKAARPESMPLAGPQAGSMLSALAQVQTGARLPSMGPPPGHGIWTHMVASGYGPEEYQWNSDNNEQLEMW